jgi:hypothetical protein
LQALALGTFLFHEEKLHLHGLFHLSFFVPEDLFVLEDLLAVLISNLLDLPLLFLDSID